MVVFGSSHSLSTMAIDVIPETTLIPEIRSFRWSAIFAGAIAGLASCALLWALGLAIGLTTVEPSDTGSLKASGLFTGIWGIITPLVGLFIGGLVAGRGAGIADRVSGALHGLVVWGLATLAGAWLFMSLLGSVASGVASAGKAVIQGGGEAVSAAGNAAQSFGLDANDALAPVNQRLQAQGRPTVSADQLQAAAGDAVRNALRTGNLDRATLARSIAQNTQLSQADADEIAGRVQAQLERFRQTASTKVQAGANKATDTTAKAMWGLFIALVLGLISAVIGGLLGVGRARHYAEVPAPEPRERTRPLTPREA